MPAVEVICNDVRQTRRVAGVFDADEETRETVSQRRFAARSRLMNTSLPAHFRQ
jgi:hypothetical protein